MRIRTLRRDDVPAAKRLSEQAGWNQTAADWRRLLELAPDDCFAGVVDGEVVATSTLVTYGGTAGWIGMVLVDEDHRGQGFGTRIFQRALEAGTDRELAAIGLDATDAGRAVYRKRGFVDVAPIERWGGTLDAPGASAGDGEILRDPPLADVLPLDRQACGLDRSTLLDRLRAEEGTTTLLVADEKTDESSGYAVVRPGRVASHLGPIVATDADALADLLAGVEDVTDEDVLVDVLGGHDAKTLLRDAGLEQRRRLTRMTYREPARTMAGEDVVAAAGFELG